MEPEIWIKPTGKQKKILDVTCGDRTIWFQIGHRSGKKMNTHWMCFMKFDDCPNCGERLEPPKGE